MEDDFDWIEDDDFSFILREQLAISVSIEGPHVAIRASEWGMICDDDAVILILKEHVYAVAKAMLGLVGLSLDVEDSKPEIEPAKPKVLTAAERSRRYRDAKRAERDASVTPRDARHDKPAAIDLLSRALRVEEEGADDG